MSTPSLTAPAARQGWSRLRAELRSLQSLIVFAFLTGVLFQSAELALIWTFGLGIHEAAHLVLIRLHGIRARMGFGVLGAWTWSPLHEREALSHTSNAIIHLAGPFANLLVALLALTLHMAQRRTDDHLLILANFNALLALFNVLPLGGVSDGGKVVKRVLASLDDRGDRWIILAALGAGVLTCLVGLAWLLLRVRANQVPFQISALLAAVLWTIITMVVESRSDNPADAASPRAMSRASALACVVALLAMLLVSTLLVLDTPYFITEDRTLHMLVGLARLLLGAILFVPAALAALLGHELGRLAGARLLGLPAGISVGPARGALGRRWRLTGLTIEVRQGLPLPHVSVASGSLLAASLRQRALFALAGPLANLLIAAAVVAALPQPAAGLHVAAAGLRDLAHTLALLLLGPLGLWPGGETLFHNPWAATLALAHGYGIGAGAAWWVICNICLGALLALPLPGLSGSPLLMSLWHSRQRGIGADDLAQHWQRWSFSAAMVWRWALGLTFLYHLVVTFVL